MFFFFFWHEGEAKRGASEIGTCLLHFLRNKSEAANSNDLDIVLYSDNCGGQGKNKFIITAYLYAVAKYKINSITHKFLVVARFYLSENILCIVVLFLTTFDYFSMEKLTSLYLPVLCYLCFNSCRMRIRATYKFVILRVLVFLI